MMGLPRWMYNKGRLLRSVQHQRCISTTLTAYVSGSISKSHLLDAPTINHQLVDNTKLKFIDVRRPEIYAQGHIPNAVNIHDIFTYLFSSQKEADEYNNLHRKFEKHFQDAGINGDERVIVYEDNLKAMNGASSRGLYLMKLLGHQNVAVLNGGLQAWTMHGFPTSTLVPQTPSGKFSAKWSELEWISKRDIDMAIKDNNTVLLDVRDRDEWVGRCSSPKGNDAALRRGRLPGAIHMYWYDFLKTADNGITYFQDPSNVKAMCNDKGLKQEDKIIIYCFKGARASVAYIALREAGFNVFNYFGSWNDWSRDYTLEIDSKQF